MREDQSVAEMANEVLMRQARIRSERSGEPIEVAMEAVLNTEAGNQLRELRNGPHGEESVEASVSGRTLKFPRTVSGMTIIPAFGTGRTPLTDEYDFGMERPHYAQRQCPLAISGLLRGISSYH